MSLKAITSVAINLNANAAADDDDADDEGVCFYLLAEEKFHVVPFLWVIS